MNIGNYSLTFARSFNHSFTPFLFRQVARASLLLGRWFSFAALNQSIWELVVLSIIWDLQLVIVFDGLLVYLLGGFDIDVCYLVHHI